MSNTSARCACRGFGVIHTAVTDLDSVAVKYLAKAVILREAFVNLYAEEFVPDVVADVLSEWRVLLENVVSLSVFAFGCRGGFVVEGVLISAFVNCFLVPGAALSNAVLSDERDKRRLLMPAGMFFVVIGG